MMSITSRHDNLDHICVCLPAEVAIKTTTSEVMVDFATYSQSGMLFARTPQPSVRALRTSQYSMQERMPQQQTGINPIACLFVCFRPVGVLQYIMLL